MTSDASQKGGNSRYAITYNVICANQKTGSFVYHWLRALATSFPAIFSGIGRHFKRFVNTSIRRLDLERREQYIPVDPPPPLVHWDAWPMLR